MLTGHWEGFPVLVDDEICVQQGFADSPLPSVCLTSLQIVHHQIPFHTKIKVLHHDIMPGLILNSTLKHPENLVQYARLFVKNVFELMLKITGAEIIKTKKLPLFHLFDNK